MKMKIFPGFLLAPLVIAQQEPKYVPVDGSSGAYVVVSVPTLFPPLKDTENSTIVLNDLKNKEVIQKLDLSNSKSSELSSCPEAQERGITGDVCCSIRDGSWSTSVLWDCGRVPQQQDVVIVRHDVSFPSDVIQVNIAGLWLVRNLESGKFGNLFRGKFEYCSNNEGRYDFAWSQISNTFKLFDKRSFVKFCSSFSSALSSLNHLEISIGERK
eukprot:GHVP01021702.1.p1 GENE.GHVP01021702.1~~GHVP01021702.1.p1  ORF type:complete len:213 (+),score=33.43 GHVP01021702.1:40-678(+)